MGGDNGMDIRLPMGLMFSIIGAIIAVYGFSTRGTDFYETPQEGININLVWGGVMLAFGLGMLLLTLRAAGNRRSKAMITAGFDPLTAPAGDPGTTDADTRTL